MNTQNPSIRHQCSKVGKFTLAHSVLFMLFVGCIVTVLGLVLDCMHETSILAQGGLQAVDDYRHTLQASPINSPFQCLLSALQWRMPTTGSNLQVLGLASCYLLTPLFLSAVLSKRFVAHHVSLQVPREFVRA